MNSKNVCTKIRPASHPSPSMGKGRGGGDHAGIQRIPDGASRHWDVLIQAAVQNLWPEMDWRIIKCQIRQESAFNPRVVSPCGAIGLMQIMPATGQSLGISRVMLFDPEENVRAGIIYLKQQYVRFPEIPDHSERIKFSLASYNGGRGYINRAIALARKEDAVWQTWDGVKQYLASTICTVGGKHPDHRQIIAYVERIWADYQNGVNKP